MTEKPANPPLFYATTASAEYATDITLRDLFAGMAATGWMRCDKQLPSPQKVAKAAYELADALLSAREEGGGDG